MRLRIRIVAVTAAAAVIGVGIVACSAADSGPGARPASDHAAAMSKRKGGRSIGRN